ncbi:DUF6985 domain-containing protein [Saccharibacillus deserti]|uniref:DUF6985 domain-containing protein n=1 Tax=Saccharibacillus deserti TaxID=1634444 RepID=UPI00155453D5|nr:hypothetical protein [Saccharibacillus deserti]
MKDLLQKVVEDENGIRGEIHVPLFGKFTAIEGEPGVTPDYLEKCAESLLGLSEEAVEAICRYTFEFCRDAAAGSPDAAYSEQLAEIAEPRGILGAFELSEVRISEPEDPKVPALDLLCSCPWDEENGMQILILDGTVVYVGVYDGLNAWQDNLEEWGNYAAGYRLND